MPRKLRIPDGIQVHCLPPLCMDSSGKLFDPQGRDKVEKILEMRTIEAVEIARRFNPDVLIVEMFPFGRKKFAIEILALIQAARTAGATKVFCSVRDILVTKRPDQQRFDQRAVAVLNREFDALLVHADPRFIDLSASFSSYDDIRIPVHYTGYIVDQNIRPNEVREIGVIVSAGGGRVGRRLIEVAAQAFPTVKNEFGLDMLIVTGSLGSVPGGVTDSAAGLKTVEFVNDFPQLLARSRLSISQCGYNTAMEVLKAEPAAVFVPFETPREDEQLRRADHFAASGRSVTLREADLTVNALVDAAREALAGAGPGACLIDTDGLAKCGRIVESIFTDG